MRVLKEVWKEATQRIGSGQNGAMGRKLVYYKLADAAQTTDRENGGYHQ